MQLKLLNYYKMISNIAGNLVGAFVPLIIYNATHSLVWAVAFLAMRSFFRLVSLVILRKNIQRKPELFLFLRLFAMALYCICLSFVDRYLILGCILASFFSGMDQSFNSLAIETLFNYSVSAKVDSKSIGITRLFEKFGVFAGLIVGGLILDVNEIVVYVLAVSLYLIAILPLFIYYLKNRKNNAFNKEYTSNAVLSLSNKETEHKTLKYVLTTMLLCYGLVYAIFASMDVTTGIFNLSRFVEGDVSYSFASMFVLVADIAYCIGNIVISRLDKKFDLLNVVRISCFIECVSFIIMTFVKNIPVIFIVFAIFGFFSATISVFVLQRFVQKSRILGHSNEGLIVREVACVSSYIVYYLIIMLLAIFEIPIRYFFLATSLTMLVSAFLIPYMEEKTRKMLVDYVEDNEVGSSIVNQTNKKTM